MKQAGYDDLVIFYNEVDSVREPSDQTAPEFVVDFLIKERITGNVTGAGIEHTKKFMPNPDDFVSYQEKPPIASSSTSGRKRRV
jgi:hypothetical protein